MSPRIRKVLKIVAYSVGGFGLFLGLLLVSFRVALSYVPEYRAQVQQWVSERTGLDIQFSSMGASLRLYGPEIVFDSAVVRSADGQRRLVRARQVRVAFDPWTALSTLRLAAARITLNQPELQIIRTQAGKFEIVGQSELDRDPQATFRADELPTGRLAVVDARVSFRDLKSGRGPWIVPDLKSGRGPWIVPGVSFDLERSGRAMQLSGAAEMPAKLGKSLRFSAETAGELSATQDLQWKFQVEARDLDLAGWLELSPKDLPAPQRGTGSFAVAGEFVGATVTGLHAQVQFNKVALTLPQWTTPIPQPAKLEPYIDEDIAGAAAEKSFAEVIAASPARIMPTIAEYDRIVFDVQLERSQGTAASERAIWDLRVKDLELSRPGKPWRRSALSARVAQGDGGALHVTGQSELLVLDNLWPLLAYAPESEALSLVRALDVGGRIVDVQADFARASAEAAPTYGGKARFVDLRTAAIGKAPGIANFSGVVEGGDAGGKIDLNVRNGQLDIPRYFRTPLPAERIAGTMTWERSDRGWRITTGELVIDSADGHAVASGEVLVPPGGASPEVNIRARGADLVARAAPRYMPASKLSPKTLEWLDRAFVAGAVPNAEFEMRGPVRAFPFRKDEGLFLIKAQVTGLTLDYQPGWIPATNLIVDAEFRNAGMSAKLLAGDVNGLQLMEARGKFVDFKQAELQLEANVNGELAKALDFMQRSPVGPAIGEQFMALRGSGRLQSTVNLTLPFKDIEKRKLQVNATIADATAGVAAIEQNITQLNGTLRVQDLALHSLAMQGRFLGGPVAIRGNVEGRYTGSGAGLIVNAQGRAQANALTTFAKLPKSVALGGTMDWRFVAHSPRHTPNTPARPTYKVESDTRGLAIGLPEPIGKPAELARELLIEADATEADRLLLRGSFGDVRALVRLRRSEGAWSIDRGGLRADGVAAALPAHPGLRVEGTIRRFVLDDWLKLKGDGPGKFQLSDLLRAANVRIGRFGYLGFDIADVRALLQATPTSYRIDVAGAGVGGQVTIPYVFDAGEPLLLELTHLDVPDRVDTGRKEKRALVDAADADPRDVPAILGRVDKLSFNGRPVGIARFHLEKTPRGVQLTNGELRSESFTATARGSWLAKDTGSVSSVVLDVASTNVADTLRAFNYRDLISGKRANAHANLTWPGGIDDDLLGRASGKVKIEMFDGQLLAVDPGGAGRMLGLLSIGALPRRLSLDFSDVTDRGFSFDKINADFVLTDGDAYTSNLLMSGPQAEVGIVGRTGLGKHDYDQTAVVTGDIGGSLSVAGAVVGGPVVGAAVLAFTRLFKEPLKGVTRRYYRITGPWESPNVERIDKEEAQQGSASAQAPQATSETASPPGTQPTPAPDTIIRE